MQMNTVRQEKESQGDFMTKPFQGVSL